MGTKTQHSEGGRKDRKNLCPWQYIVSGWINATHPPLTFMWER
jgi:hypothetical protein